MKSVTSLDGLDFAICQFWQSNNNWNCKILAAQTIIYPNYRSTSLSGAHKLPGNKLMELHTEYGKFFGQGDE